jgi:hypothetical protein
MTIPRPAVWATAAAVLILLAFTAALARDRNPLPFPDGPYQVFTASSPAAMHAMIDLLGRHGHKPRFRLDTDGVDRAILWDGTIINYTHPELFERLGRPAAAIGLVAADPVTSAMEAVTHLRDRGFQAAMIEGAEPGLPIVFVTTDALNGSVLVFRKHQLRMGRRPDPWPGPKT